MRDLIDTETKGTILVVDDEKTNINVLVHLLFNEYTLHVAKDGPTTLKIAQEHLPDLILLDVVMPEMNGYQILEELRNIPSTENIPVIFITGLNSSEDEQKGLALGVVDYISKPFNPSIVKLRIRNQMKLINYMRIVEKISMTDSLTGLNNRRSFNDRLRIEWGRALREELPISLIMVDVDHFKHYNDTYGHQQGDVVLQTVASVFVDALNRTMDFVARWGGEEFIILLPSTDIEGAEQVAEKIRESVENLEIPLNDGTITKVTVSAGVSGLIPNANSNTDQFISNADKALYDAKGKGRNRVVSMGNA